LFLFTRIVIPDVILTLSTATALWSLLRTVDEEEQRPRLWAYGFWASLAWGLLIKGLIGLVFPVGISVVFVLLKRRLFDGQLGRRLYRVTGMLLFLAIALPWHVLVILANPPYFDFTMHSTPFQWRGFFWFYFVNDQVLRFMNARYPRDYN